MRVVLISLFDEYCLPLRYASSLMQNEGYDVQMIFVKGLAHVSPQLVPASEDRTEGGYFGYLSWITQTELDLLIQAVQKTDALLIGLHVSPLHAGLAAHITNALSQAVKTPIVWSGVDPSINPETAIKSTDYLISGECEETYLDLCKAIHSNGSLTNSDLTQIPNLWAKQDGQIYKNDRRALRDNLDDYPFADYEWTNKRVIQDDVILESPFPSDSALQSNFVTRISRGCPIDTACYFHGLDDTVYLGDTRIRRRSWQNVVEEMKYRVRTWRTPLQRIDFYDPCLPSDSDYITQFAEELGSEIGLPTSGYIHPGLADYSTLPVLSYYGLNHLTIGIPSGSGRTLKELYGSGLSRQGILECAQEVRKAGLKFVTEVYGYNPLETEEDKQETLSLICDLPKPYGMKRVIPTPFLDGLPLLQKAQEAGCSEKLEKPEGVHGYTLAAQSEDVFWDRLFTLGHLNNFTKEYIMNFTQDEYMRENPELFSEYIDMIYDSTYAYGNPLLDKDDYVGHLRWKIAQLESSPVYRAYHKVKTLVR